MTNITAPVFIIGTGRSGTHWLGYTLKQSKDIRVTVETPPIFQMVTQMALDPTLVSSDWDNLMLEYNKQLRSAGALLYVDKSHPNVWLVEPLKVEFPEARFIGIERNPFATVASMLRHNGVRAWHTKWREFPVPNRFLGITAKNVETYDSMPIAAQCALRWCVHHERMRQLQQTLTENELFVVSYESFARSPQQTVDDLSAFLGDISPLSCPTVKLSSLDNWKTQLSVQEIKQIQHTLDKFSIKYEPTI